MKKKTLLNAITVLLLIIMGVSIVISGFIEGESSRICCHWDIVFRLLMDTNNSEVLI